VRDLETSRMGAPYIYDISRLRVKKELFFLNRCTGQSPADSDDTRGCIYTITT